MIHFAPIAGMIAAILQAAPAPAPAPIDCADADHSAFNFWIGEWDVVDTRTETVVAQSTIAPVAGGCALEETYRQAVGPGGVPSAYRGASYSAFDPVSHTWRQFYVDSAGALTMFEGGLVSDGSMVLVGPRRTDALQVMMTLTPQPDGSVRQVGATSIDGSSWSPGSYDFTYRRR